jgi:enoyl-CoA hydratase
MADPSEPVLLSEPTPWGVRLTLNRPAKLNAINPELRDALTAAIADAVADEAVRVIVIAGAGRAFCSGYDLAEAQPDTAWGWRGVLGADVDATLAIWRSPKPVIAQVHGYALAGGLELAMACDLIVAAADAQLGEPEIRFGSAPVAVRPIGSGSSIAWLRPNAWSKRRTPWPTGWPACRPTSWRRPS